MRLILWPLLTLLWLTALVASSAAARPVVDQAGRSVEVPEHPQRVVSLAPSLTEIVYSLGQEAKLVGATQYSDYPEAARRLPRVGSYVRLDVERIVALKPDLCLAIKDGNPRHVIDKIEALGIPVYAINPRNLEQIMAAIGQIGTLLDADDRAALLVADMAARIARVRQRVSRTPERPRVFFQVDAAPIVSAGSNTFTDELIRLAGGINLAAGSIPYPRYNWEEALRLQPEVVLITSMSGGHSPEELLAQWRQWPQVPAVRSGRLHVVEAACFDRPTARLVRGLETLAALFHPQLFANRADGMARSGEEE